MTKALPKVLAKFLAKPLDKAKAKTFARALAKPIHMFFLSRAIRPGPGHGLNKAPNLWPRP